MINKTDNKIVLGNMDYYLLPGTNNMYYINVDGDVYSMHKHKVLTNSKNTNSIRLTINGKQKRFKVKDAIIEALFNYIEEISQ